MAPHCKRLPEARQQDDPAIIGRMHEAESSAEPAADRPDLGLLFIHGIGAQAKGATLVAWLDALSQWMDAWLSGAARSAAQCGVSQEVVEPLTLPPEARNLLQAARLPPRARERRTRPLDDTRLAFLTGTVETTTASLSSSEAPARAQMRIRAVDRHGIVATSTIAVAEAYWQQSFPPPTWRETAQWLLRIAPLMVLLHFGHRVRERLRLVRHDRGALALPSLLASLLQLLMAITVLPLVQVVFTLFSTFGWIPIPVYGSLMAWLQAVVAGVLGDAYMFATSPTRLAAVVTETRKALDTLSHCKKVIVVAHSQGAAVAYGALEDGGPANLAGVLTLGSGLKKLDYLKSFRREHDVSLTFVVNYSLAAMTTTLAYVLARTYGGLPNLLGGWEGFVVTVMAVLTPATLAMASLLTVPTIGLEQWWAKQRAGNPTLRWLDVFASHDPVSAGRLFAAPLDGMESVSVINRASWAADHTTYWENVDQFVTKVGTWISEVGTLAVPLHALNTLDGDLVKEAATRRVWRVRVLTLSTWAIVGVAVIAVTAGVATPYERAMNALVGEATGGRWDRSDVQAGLLMVVAAAGLLLVVTRGIWRLWDRHEAKAFCSREPDVNVTVVLGFLAALPAVLAVWFVLDAVVGR